jgi:hypothetical protein
MLSFPNERKLKMNTARSCYNGFGVVILCLTFASLAHATSTRTWVSGVGTNAGACTRAAPCKTFAFALGQTTAGGEIDALDPGDYGIVTIDRAITIDGTQGGGFASIIVPSTGTGVTVHAGTSDVVTLRNLAINGTNAVPNIGVYIVQAGTVHIENCVVSGFSNGGIVDIRGGATNSVWYLYVKDTVSRNSGIGIQLQPASSGIFIIASLTNVRAQDNTSEGVLIVNGGYASLDHCNITGNSDGLLVFGNGGPEGTANAASASVKNSVLSNNGNGITANSNGAIVRISGVQVFDNTKGLNQIGGGVIVSYGNNEIDGNTTDGAPSSTIPKK